MENEFLSKVEDNVAVRAWSEKLQTEKGDSLTEGYTSELQNFTRIIVTQNELQELKDIWTSWDEGTKRLFYQSYGDIPYLLDVKVDKRLFRGMAQFWNAAYNCFTFGEINLVPTLEEYTALLRSPKAQVGKIYAKLTNSQTFAKRLVNILGMSESRVTARIQQKGDSKCVPWENLKDLILTHLDEKKRVEIFALSIYGLVIFPRALRHVDEAVTDLFDHLGKGVTPVPAILAETFRSLSMCRKAGESRFIGCAQLLMVWFHGHFWKVDKEGDVEWRAFWMVPDKILYRCGDYNWVPLLGIWRATGYTPLLALRQYKSRQFIPTTHGLAQCELPYKGDHYKKKVRELSDTWRQMHWMKRLTVDSIVTPEYNDFEKKSSEFGKKIEQLEEEKIHLKLEMDIQKSEAEKLQKRKGKVEEDLESLKTYYKKLRLSIRTAGLGKTSEQWRQEVRKEKAKADQWEKKFQEAQARNEALERSLLESKNEKDELRAKVAELERFLCLYRNRNSVTELKVSLSKLEVMKGKIEELETALQNCEMRIEFLEANEEQWKNQLHHSQDQVRNRDYIMGEAVTQIREVADYLQYMAVQADVLSVKYELESDRGQELASLLRKINALSVRAKSYL
ncbi:hypothetical protein CXB51_021782 [Gossypium anomalum]|uniref:DUF7745 domain-containing protein n=1 Tax=Gossypium anomalum TaxID=47600 RepID=A0A8J5YYI1_9ROSI|nr:hypothetical protein CXB51_021782 [Gossypium anomalum]